MSYRQSIRVRYGECDMQRVVFNANYFVYCDDVVDSWTRVALADELKAAGSSTDLHAIGFDFMLKNTNLTWHAPVRFGETIDMSARVSRWGKSSFDVSIDGSVDGESRFDAVITYVSVDPATQRPTSVPDVVRAALDR
ncbi:MAG: acyl-CoA thioesterase [Actinomycetota bacterium]